MGVSATGGTIPDASLNEVRALCRKAARGAGYAWGMADEAGRFASLLSRRGIDGPRAVHVLLRQVEGCDPEAFTPDPTRPGWASRQGKLCPLATGTALLDRSSLFPSLLPLRLGNVMAPVLLLAVRDLLAAGCDHFMQLEWGGMRFPGRLHDRLRPGEEEAFRRVLDDVRMELTVSQDLGDGAVSSRQAIDPMTWDALDRYAARTYAHATEFSRHRGAGESGGPPAESG